MTHPWSKHLPAIAERAGNGYTCFATMSERTTDGQSNEQALVKLYMELTGTTESGARSVLMYVDSPDAELAGDTKPSTSPLSKS